MGGARRWPWSSSRRCWPCCSQSLQRRINASPVWRPGTRKSIPRTGSRQANPSFRKTRCSKPSVTMMSASRSRAVARARHLPQSANSVDCGRTGGSTVCGMSPPCRGDRGPPYPTSTIRAATSMSCSGRTSRWILQPSPRRRQEDLHAESWSRVSATSASRSSRRSYRTRSPDGMSPSGETRSQQYEALCESGADGNFRRQIGVTRPTLICWARSSWAPRGRTTSRLYATATGCRTAGIERAPSMSRLRVRTSPETSSRFPTIGRF